MFTKNTLEALLEKSGFVIVESKLCHLNARLDGAPEQIRIIARKSSVKHKVNTKGTAFREAVDLYRSLDAYSAKVQQKKLITIQNGILLQLNTHTIQIK